LKKIVVIAVLGVFFFSTIWNLVVLGDYAIRYSYYSQVLCINKNKPELQCNGNCQLIKNLNSGTSHSTPVKLEVHIFRFIGFINDYNNDLFAFFAGTGTKVYSNHLTLHLDTIYLNTPTPPPKKVFV